MGRTDLDCPRTSSTADGWAPSRVDAGRSAALPTGQLVAEIDESTAVDTESAIAAAAGRLRRRSLGSHQRTRAGRRSCSGSPTCSSATRPRWRGWSRSTPASAWSRASIDIDDVTSVFRHFGLVADAEAGRVVDTGTRRRGQPGGARAGRRLRADHPVELPAAAGLVEGRASLAAGNTFVLKPSELTPHTAIHLMRLLDEAGAARRGRATWSSATDRTPVRRSARTRGWTWSPSPVGSRPASGSWPPPRAR